MKKNILVNKNKYKIVFSILNPTNANANIIKYFVLVSCCYVNIILLYSNNLIFLFHCVTNNDVFSLE